MALSIFCNVKLLICFYCYKSHLSMNNELKFESYWELHLEMNTQNEHQITRLIGQFLEIVSTLYTWSVLWKLSNERKTSRWMKNHKKQNEASKLCLLGFKNSCNKK